MAAAIGYVGVTHSFAQVVARSDIELAHRLAPRDGRITARLAASLVGPDATVADRRRADRLALDALRREPTAVAAVSTLGLDAQVRGDTSGARRLFAYSQTLSRRDLPTQIWAIEDAVARGSIPEALRHYDTALRAFPTASEVLYPVLASASADPAIRAALVRTLVGRPRWTESFIAYASTSKTDPRSLAQLFSDMRRAGIAVPESAGASMVNALIAAGYGEDAWRHYASIRPGVDRAMSRDPGFTANLAAPSRFDWVPTSDGSVSAAIQRGDRGGIFDFATPAGVGGPLLQQEQMLPPGAYRLAGHSIGIDQPDGAQPYWTLRCGGSELGRVVLPNSSQADGRFAGMFQVTAQCPVQTLVLVAQPSDAAGGLSGQIDRFQLSRIR